MKMIQHRLLQNTKDYEAVHRQCATITYTTSNRDSKGCHAKHGLFNVEYLIMYILQSHTM